MAWHGSRHGRGRFRRGTPARSARLRTRGREQPRAPRAPREPRQSCDQGDPARRVASPRPRPGVWRSALPWVPVDLLDRASVMDAIAGNRPAVVYHCGGAAHVGHAWSRSEVTLTVNVRGTQHLLDALSRAGATTRVLIPSSAPRLPACSRGPGRGPAAGARQSVRVEQAGSGAYRRAFAVRPPLGHGRAGVQPHRTAPGSGLRGVRFRAADCRHRSRAPARRKFASATWRRDGT